MAALKPIQKSRISDEVVVQLTHLILDGSFPVNRKLPPERELARQLSINRTSLREALRRLETMGLIKVRPGDGIFVQDPSTHSGIEFVQFLLSSGIGLDKRLIMDMAEIRKIFATAMIELACERINNDSLSALQEIVDRFPREATPERLSGELDFAFFREIAQATQNKVFIYILNTIKDLMQKMSGVFYQVEDGPEVAANLYRGLVDAIRARDKQRAVSLFLDQAKRDDERLAQMLEGMS